ncbi:hypothetical protein, partial [Pseudomonas palmensis]
VFMLASLFGGWFISRRTLARQKAAVATRTGDSKGAACGVYFTLEGTRATVLQKRPRKGR